MSFYSKISHPQYDAVAFLKTVSLFTNLQKDDLADIAKRVTRHPYPSGVTLFHQDTPGTLLYMLEEGRVRVFGVGITGQEHTLNTFGPGEIFGELSILDGKPRSASAMTMTPSVIWMLSKTDFDYFLEKCFAFSKTLMILLAERIRTTASHVEAIIFQDVQGRLAYELLHLSEKHGNRTPEGILIEIPLTQNDLAAMVGATRESVNKAFVYLRGQNLVQVDGTQITVLDSEGLSAVMFQRGR